MVTRRKVSGILFLAILIFNVVLLSDLVRPAAAMKKKKLMKKLKDIMPILMMLKV